MFRARVLLSKCWNERSRLTPQRAVPFLTVWVSPLSPVPEFKWRLLALSRDKRLVQNLPAFPPFSVDNSTKQRWLEICVHAAIEEDPERLKELAREINRMLAEEELRLRQFPAHKLRA